MRTVSTPDLWVCLAEAKLQHADRERTVGAPPMLNCWIRRLLEWGSLASLAAVVATSSAASAASNVSIDFESLALDEFVTNQFADQLVIFGNAVTLVSGISLNEIDFPPTSGVNVISGLGAGPLGAAFVQPAHFVAFSITTADTAVVRYYDTTATLLGQSLVDANLGSSSRVEFDTAGQVIAGLTFSSLATNNAFFLTVDDFEAAIPEPSALLAMAVGLLPIAFAVRRRA
jgi:hypothetical protein